MRSPSAVFFCEGCGTPLVSPASGREPVRYSALRTPSPPTRRMQVRSYARFFGTSGSGRSRSAMTSSICDNRTHRRMASITPKFSPPAAVPARQPCDHDQALCPHRELNVLLSSVVNSPARPVPGSSRLRQGNRGIRTVAGLQRYSGLSGPCHPHLTLAPRFPETKVRGARLEPVHQDNCQFAAQPDLFG